MTILNIYEKTESLLFGRIGICAIAIVILMIIIYALKNKEQNIFISFVIFLAIVIIPIMINLFVAKEEVSFYMKCKIDDTVSFNDVMDDFEPVEKDGEVWTLKVRKDRNEEENN